MDANAIASLITTVGFPIVMCGALMWYIAKSQTQHKEETKEYADLRSVMDYTIPFELIYSGVENESYYDILYDMGVRNFLMSYHYIQNKHINMAQRFEGQNVRLFIDSGAHTY